MVELTTEALVSRKHRHGDREETGTRLFHHVKGEVILREVLSHRKVLLPSIEEYLVTGESLEKWPLICLPII